MSRVALIFAVLFLALYMASESSAANPSSKESLGRDALTRAKKQSRTGNIAGAKETAAAISEDSIQAEAYAAIAEAQAKAGDITGAKKTAELISHNVYKTQAYLSIAVAQKSKAGGNVKGRNKIFAQAKEAAALIRNSSDRAKAHMAIAMTQAEIGDFTGAQKTAKLVPWGPSRMETNRNIALIQAKAGHFNGARKTASLIGDYNLRVRVYSEIDILERQRIP